MTEAEMDARIIEHAEEEPTLEQIEEGIQHGYSYPDDKYSGNEIENILQVNGYRNLGWLNSGVKIPEGVEFRKVYANWTGSYCIYIDKFRHYYCVDMGD